MKKDQVKDQKDRIISRKKQSNAEIISKMSTWWEYETLFCQLFHHG